MNKGKTWRLREGVDWRVRQGRPDYAADSHDPFLFQDMDRAVEILAAAIKNGEKIFLFADYDADGTIAAAIITAFFRRIGHTNFEIYIPDRQTEAFGLSARGVEQAAKSGATVLLTVDCGSANREEIKLAKELGLKVIVTDHHRVPEPEIVADAFINHQRPGDAYPEKILCGAGVAFKLVQALVNSGQFEVEKDWPKRLLDLAAIATVADLVPLTGENRALTYFGLKLLPLLRRPGLVALAEMARLNLARVTEDDIAFSVVPRLNAASRMSHGREAYELLIARDESEALALAASLENHNGNRKLAVINLLTSVEALFEPGDLPPVLVAGHDSWSPGLLGLAAGRLADRYNRPAFLWGRSLPADGRGGATLAKGSCRAPRGVNVVELMQIANNGEGYFSDYGGHEVAGGFSLAYDRVGDLAGRLTEASRQIEVAHQELAIEYDEELELGGVGEELMLALEQAAPFGAGHPKPVFKLASGPILGARAFGGERNHLELALTGGLKAVSFFAPDDWLVKIKRGAKIDFLATLEHDHFSGRGKVRLRIVDLKI